MSKYSDDWCVYYRDFEGTEKFITGLTYSEAEERANRLALSNDIASVIILNEEKQVKPSR